MAAVSQTITLNRPTSEQFGGLPFGTNNIYPRSRVVFQDATAITLKAAGNTNTLIYNMTLPRNYAYRLDEVVLFLGLSTSTEVDQFEDLGEIAISFNSGSSNLIHMVMRSEGLVSQSSVAGGLKVWNVQDRFSSVFRSQGPNDTIIMQLRLYDNDGVNETVAQTSSLHVSALQYDISQILDVAVNAPQPVFSV